MLNFEYDGRSGESVAEYGALIVKAIQDSDCGNPWEDSDGMTPLIAYSLGGGWMDFSAPHDLESPLSRFTDRQLALKWRPLCAALDLDAATAEREARESQRCYGGALADIRRDTLESALLDMRPDGSRSWGAACDYLAALESLWTLAGVAALDFQRNGYSQGDSVRGLLVATPEWRSAMGIKASAPMGDDLAAQADCFGAWAFGDCYGFQIESPDGEALDSCWGFVGDDFSKSGLAEAAEDSAAYIVRKAAERRNARLAELIRNRVPLDLRPAQLAAAAQLESI